MPETESQQDLRHVGRWPDRLLPNRNNPCEVAFAEQWQKEQSVTNTLAWLVCTKYAGKSDPSLGGLFGGQIEDCKLSQRDAEVAATVIQWLGSNVGFSFLQEALEKCGYRIVSKEK